MGRCCATGCPRQLSRRALAVWELYAVWAPLAEGRRLCGYRNRCAGPATAWCAVAEPEPMQFGGDIRFAGKPPTVGPVSRRPQFAEFRTVIGEARRNRTTERRLGQVRRRNHAIPTHVRPSLFASVNARSVRNQDRSTNIPRAVRAVRLIHVVQEIHTRRPHGLASRNRFALSG